MQKNIYQLVIINQFIILENKNADEITNKYTTSELQEHLVSSLRLIEIVIKLETGYSITRVRCVKLTLSMYW